MGIKIDGYNKVNVKSSKTELRKLKITVKNKTERTLRRYHQKLFTLSLVIGNITKNKARNAFENNMSSDVKLPKTQISKTIQCRGILQGLLRNISGLLIKVAPPF